MDAWVLFNAAGLSTARQHALLDTFGDPDTILGASDEQLTAVEGITAREVKKIRGASDELDIAEAKETLMEWGIHVVSRDSEEYPDLLAETEGAPPMLFVQGQIPDGPAVAIVGTRKCTPYGRQVSERLARDLVRRGFTVISGMAEGIDGEAHRGAIKGGGKTVAVLGCGPDVTYPRSHRELREDIAANGAVISEYPLGTPPHRYNFPARNRIISGLSLGAVVVEAPSQSGALITARLASEQGREVFAVPGSVESATSRGCHELIKDGAGLVEVAEDIVEGLGIMLDAVPMRPKEKPEQVDVTPEEETILGALSHEPTGVDDISEETGIDVASINSTLMMMEMKKLVRRFPGNTYVKVPQ